jgi:phosphoglycolate phosphatase-like HAD superfamily hydrolase
MHLVLWDIDHTLVDTRGVGRELFGEAFQRTLGIPMQRQARIDGLTDPVIFRETAALHGKATTAEDFDRFAVALGELHLTRTAEILERGHALAGASAALSALAEAGVRQTVVTGNIRASAQVKLSVFGLDKPIAWDAGAYGEDGETRPELVRHALERAAAYWGQDTAPGRVVLIGDTPADIQGAVAAGVRPVGVASGRSTKADLKAAGAAITLPSLADTGAVLRAAEASPA